MDLESLNCKIVGDDDAENMIKGVSDLEIKDALFDICDNKARYSAKFYKSAWSVAGKEVCETVREFFRNGKIGLRQGDLISLYIFTLVMEVFTLILKKKISEDGKFRYHWGCKELNISHLCFADDLLVLFHGDLNFVKWLKGESIWNVGCEKNSSYGWKQILSLRDKIRNHVISMPVPNLDQGVNNVILWKTKSGQCVNFSTNKAWNDWRITENIVDWCDTICFSNCTPKHSFIMWMAVQGRVTTQERLRKWYPEKQLTCLLWDDIIRTMATQKRNKSIKSVLRRLTLTACVYYIWQERNRKFDGVHKEGFLNGMVMNFGVAMHVGRKRRAMKLGILISSTALQGG
nr:RNA-directed DNA polymerase, eukaryota, reverse transcriptase zinc-binding domain protein [Tanacetum cinerariifolium]